MPEYKYEFEDVKLWVDTDAMSVYTWARTYKGAYYVMGGRIHGALVPLADDLRDLLEFDKVKDASVRNHLGDGPYCVLEVPTKDKRTCSIYFKYP